MWPWGHVALAYLLYRRVARRSVARVDRRDLAALVAGAVVPDLVDKPLAWYLGLLPSGRSLAHSLVVALAVTVLVRAVVADRGPTARSTGAAFVVGYWAHLAGDLVEALASPPPGDAVFPLYPLLTPPTPPGTGVGHYAAGLVADLGTFAATGHLTPDAAVALLELALVGVAAVAWVANGHPGWRPGGETG